MKRLIAMVLMIAAGSAIAANTVINAQPGDTVTVNVVGGGPTPPATVTCPDGSTNPAGFVCPTTPPPVTGNTCPGYAKTIWMEADWYAPVRMLTANYGGMAANDIVVYTFTTGNGASQSNNLPRIAGGEYGGGGGNRDFNLSETACKFDEPWLAYAAHGTGLPSVPFTVVTPDPYGFYPVLKFNTRYYLNVRNSPGNGCTTSCNMFFDLSKNGTP